MKTAHRSSTDSPPESIPYEPRNFWAWVAYQFFYRIGWQFKMEATLVAGLISFLTPDPRTMGLFTTVNTLGRQAAPLFAAPRVDRWPYKKQALLLFWGFTVACWAALTVFLWLPAARNRTLTLSVFGVCYTLFFIFLGASSVAQGTLLGKIIPATYRGRAMAMGMGLSGVINTEAILALYFITSRNALFAPPRNYALAFTLTVLCFLGAAGALLFIHEQPSPTRSEKTGVVDSLRVMLRLARQHRNLRLLMLVNIAVSVGGSLLQFYTGFWRSTFPGGIFPENAIIIATVLQVFWQSLSSAILGRVSDARGNRIVICGLLWIEMAVPLTAILVGGLGTRFGGWGFLLIYTLIGLRFPVFQLLVNYLLEILPSEDHAMGLGATNAIQIATAPAPLLLGLVARQWGYVTAFAIATAFLCFAAIMALRLEEPRHAVAGVGSGSGT